MMKEEITIKREWVKKAGIIFFIIMMILTFFSNTIMNFSLPEVSVQSVKTGMITTSIRGSGTAEAISTYEVMISQSRKIKEVFVQPGDTVSVGDVLFSLEDEESDELKMALDSLDDLNLQYQKMLINSSEADYASEDRNIERTQKSLEDAMAKRDENRVTRQQLGGAEAYLNTSKEQVSELTDEVAELQEKLSNYSGATDESLRSLERQIEDKKRQIKNADSGKTSNPVSISSLKLELQRLKEDYDLLIAKYPDYKSVGEDLEIRKKELNNAKKALSDAEGNNASEDELVHLKEQVSALENKVNELKNKLLSYSEFTSILRRIEDKESEIENYEPYLDGPSVDTSQLKLELERLEEDYEDMRDNSKKYSQSSRELENANDELSEANDKLEYAQKNYDELSSKYEKWKAADEDVTNIQNNLEDLMFALEERKKDDEKTHAITNLDFEKLRKDIDEQKKLVEELRNDAVNGKVAASRAGVIKSVDISAGGTTSPNMTMAVIETTDQGYSVSFSVTKEQSKKVSVGDTAKVDESSISATLTQIKNDSANPKENKILTFLLEGEVESGEIYSLDVVKDGKDYDLLVPRSALHSDSNGYFVLTMKSKRTPFGGRYTTQRVSVEILAEDDQNAAVSGNLRQVDAVITTSTRLLEPGMQIRMGNQ